MKTDKERASNNKDFRIYSTLKGISNMSKRIMYIVLLIPIVVMFAGAQSGSRVQLLLRPESKLSLEGNSTMHEYSARASQILGSFVVDSLLLGGKERPLSMPFQQADLTIPVKKLLSGNEKLDNNMYDALKTDDYPNITYHVTADSIISEAKKESLTVKTTGKLSVAGKENTIDMIVTFSKSSDSTFTIKGSKELLMTDFGIDPPSMMLGLLKTDNKIVIRFELLLRK